MCMHVHICSSVCVHICMWRPEISSGCCSSDSTHLWFSDRVSHWLAGQGALGTYPSLPSYKQYHQDQL